MNIQKVILSLFILSSLSGTSLFAEKVSRATIYVPPSRLQKVRIYNVPAPEPIVIREQNRTTTIYPSHQKYIYIKKGN